MNQPDIREIMKAWRTMYKHAGASRWPLIDEPVMTPLGPGKLMTVFGLESRVAVNGKATMIPTKDIQPVNNYEYRVMERFR